jgi:hypothetical protein
LDCRGTDVSSVCMSFNLETARDERMLFRVAVIVKGKNPPPRRQDATKSYTGIGLRFGSCQFPDTCQSLQLWATQPLDTIGFAEFCSPRVKSAGYVGSRKSCDCSFISEAELRVTIEYARAKSTQEKNLWLKIKQTINPS